MQTKLTASGAPEPLVLVPTAAPGLPGMDRWLAEQKTKARKGAEADLLRRELESLR